MEKFEKARVCIDEANKICLVAHTHPDGDAIGSLGAMYHFLKQTGKDVYIAITELPERYRFLTCENEFENEVELDEYDLLICLDVSSEDRIDICQEAKEKAKKIMVIDHHLNNTIDADAKLVIDNAPANCEVIYKLLKYMDFEITENVAKYIYTGLLTDTGSFNYEATTSTTYKIAGEMLECGIDFSNICKRLNHTYTEKSMKLIAHTINNMEVLFDGKLRIGVTDKNTIERLDLTEDDMSGAVTYLKNIENTIVAVYMKPDKEGKYKVSIRAAEPINAAELSQLFGGGGHKRAAGFTADNVEETKQKLIQTLERLLK